MLRMLLNDLFPTETPIQQLIEHSELVEVAARLLPKLTDDYFAGADISSTVEEISSLESRADDVKFQIRKAINEKVRLPFGRTAIKDIIHSQDKIIDKIKDVARMMSLNRVSGLDEEAKTTFRELVTLNLDAITLLRHALKDLELLVRSSFARKVSDEEERDITEVERLEGRIDRLSLTMATWVYAHKNALHPVDLIFFNDLSRLMSKIADDTENTAERIRNFVVK